MKTRVAAILLLAALGLRVWWVAETESPIGFPAAEIVVPPGASTQVIAEKLAAEGLIRAALDVRSPGPDSRRRGPHEGGAVPLRRSVLPSRRRAEDRGRGGGAPRGDLPRRPEHFRHGRDRREGGPEQRTIPRRREGSVRRSPTSTPRRRPSRGTSFPRPTTSRMARTSRRSPPRWRNIPAACSKSSASPPPAAPSPGRP